MSPEESGDLLKQEIARLRAKELSQQETIEALKSEFADAVDSEAISRTARKAIRDLMPQAIVQMGMLINNAESESVRASLSRFVIAVGLDKAKIEDSDSQELRTLLKDLASE